MDGWWKSHCLNKTGILFVKCIEAIAFSTTETITVYHDFTLSSNYSTKIRLFFANNWSGLVLSPQLKDGMMTKTSGSTVSLELNPSLTYRIRVTDPKLEFLSTNPDSIPRSALKLRHNSGFVVVYMKVEHKGLKNIIALLDSYII